MEIAGINLISVLAAGATGFVVAAIYYTVLAKPWQVALGKTKEEVKAIIGPGAFITAAIAQLTIAVILAGVLFHFGPEPVTAKSVLVTSVLLWVGFTVAPMAVNHRFQGAKWSLTFIDAGNWLGVLLIQGQVMVFLGLK